MTYSFTSVPQKLLLRSLRKQAIRFILWTLLQFFALQLIIHQVLRITSITNYSLANVINGSAKAIMMNSCISVHLFPVIRVVSQRRRLTNLSWPWLTCHWKDKSMEPQQSRAVISVRSAAMAYYGRSASWSTSVLGLRTASVSIYSLEIFQAGCRGLGKQAMGLLHAAWSPVRREGCHYGGQESKNVRETGAASAIQYTSSRALYVNP